ncbi:MAG: restriction endonuclease [Gammaproteobacteria bacterium]|nr:restriction endonuclease [Gammaproteobacteria bacterium]
MDLIDKIREIASKIPTQREYIQTEEATKNAFIMPFISMLGYDVFNPMEVIPEYTADIGTKKGEKVDYAVKKDNKIIILIECKWCGSDLNKEHASQLYRYFSATEVRFGLLTNGIVYKFYSDIDETNKMDSKPFFEFNILNFEEHQIYELKKFTNSAFSLDAILNTARALKYTGAVKKILDEELERPSEQFVRFFAAKIYDGKLTKSVMDQFTEIVKEARTQFVNEKINDRLKSALNVGASSAQEETSDEDMPDDKPSGDSIKTTEEKLEAYNIIKAILSEVVDINRVIIRDAKSYCSILLDNNRKPICRLRFKGSKKYISLFSNKNEDKITIENLNDIFNYSDRIKAVINEYDNQPIATEEMETNEHRASAQKNS